MQPRGNRVAFGAPGIEPRWSHSNKDGVGTAYSGDARLWFTLWRGVVTEVYFPMIDQPQLRDLQFLVTDERRSSTRNADRCARAPNGPTPGRSVQHRQRRPRMGATGITKTVLGDPHQPCLLLRTRFELLDPTAVDGPGFRAGRAPPGGRRMGELRHGLRTPRSSAVGGGKGRRGARVGCLAALEPLLRRICRRERRVDGSEPASIAGLGVRPCPGRERRTDGRAARRADGRVHARSRVRGVDRIGGDDAAAVPRDPLRGPPPAFRGAVEPDVGPRASARRPLGDGGRLLRASHSILLAHEDKVFPGAFIASLSIPWGSKKSDSDRGGYHLVWTRDLVATASALFAAGLPGRLPGAR